MSPNTARQKSGQTKAAVTRHRILTAADQLMQQQGTCKVTDLVDASGRRSATIYNHFTSLNELVTTVLVAAIETDLAILASQTTNIEDMIHCLWSCCWRYAKSHVATQIAPDLTPPIERFLANQNIRFRNISQRDIALVVASSLIAFFATNGAGPSEQAVTAIVSACAEAS